MRGRSNGEEKSGKSYIFYGYWDWRFLILIWISTVVDYTCGLIIHSLEDNKRRKIFCGLDGTDRASLYIKYLEKKVDLKSTLELDFGMCHREIFITDLDFLCLVYLQ